VSAPVALRRYTAADEAATFALWIETWQTAYPHLNFAGRCEALRVRWHNEIAPLPIIVLAVSANRIVGFFTLEPARNYVDQLAVAPDMWGTPVAAMLIEEAKRLSPACVELNVNQDNARALRFYGKHGFAATRDDVNPRSGAPIVWMRWRPGDQPV
jgi:putative acetyltransferase